MAQPPGPSEAERRRHLANHLPFAAWCDMCVRCKARASPHERRGEGEKTAADMDRPTLQADYCFLKRVEDEAPLTVLGVFSQEYGWGDATVVDRKGPSAFAVAWLARWLVSCQALLLQ